MQSLLNAAQIILENMQMGALGVNLYQVACVLLITLSALWLISHSGPVV